MKKLLFLFMLPALGFSQNFIFIGENSYPSTDIYKFENEEDPVYVSFIKGNDEILISLKQRAVLGYLKPKIDGRILIYLDNGKVIKVNAPTVKDYVDSDMTSIFLLRNEDVENLKISKINSIRFTRLDGLSGDTSDRVAKNNSHNTTLLLKDFL